MRQTLNKAITPMEKEKGAANMTKEIRQIMEATAKINAEDPAARKEYLAKLEAVKVELAEAVQAKDDADCESDFDKARSREEAAKEKIAFFRRQIEKLDLTPRMDEKTYYALLEGAKRSMSDAVMNFRKVTDKAMMEIKQAKEELLDTAADADTALQELDQAARVLQAKYQMRERKYLNAPSSFERDRNEWQRHTLRFSPAETLGLATMSNDPVKPHDSVYCAAWHAVDKAYPRQNF